MRFAVIEYSSKTKHIWRHTEGRPNYLCDPVKEIDPTSFGCYVSALQGEHIPLTSLITGANVNLIARFVRKVIKRLTHSWPQTYSLTYLKQFNALLVVYQLSDGHEMVEFLKRVRKENPRTVILGVPTQPYGILVDAWNADDEKKKEIQEFITQCDVFLTIVKSTLPKWQILTRTKVVYMPQPYPATFALQRFQMRSKKHAIIFVAGVTSRDTITKGQKVAVLLQKKFPSYRIQMAEVEGMELDVTALHGSTYDILPFQMWQEHLTMLSRVALVINTDYTYTRGRVQTDCAAVGTPSIGANSDAQDDLFPKLHADRGTSIEKLVLQGEQLLTDSSYYEDVVKTARDRLLQYTYEQSKQRMEDLVEAIRHDKK